MKREIQRERPPSHKYVEIQHVVSTLVPRCPRKHRAQTYRKTQAAPHPLVCITSTTRAPPCPLPPNSLAALSLYPSLQILLHKNLMRLRQFMAAPDQPVPDAPKDWMPPMPRPETSSSEGSDSECDSDDEVSIYERGARDTV